MSLHPSQKALDGTQPVPHIKLLPPKKADENKPAILPINMEPIDDDTEDNGKCTFCPAELCDSALVESHLCVHPLIPGYSSPTPVGI